MNLKRLTKYRLIYYKYNIQIYCFDISIQFFIIYYKVLYKVNK